ncbi:cell division protein ZapA [Parashewanella spongiae]|uniref:Cell division protein ZapA n=1 Tax=Parashewanella spongiae TaxID=342950 RepID=A0A3A6TPE5_9GAMM|nr:cell division protein ZapA [Parashewanella spongiae]MCL1079773.1 cell division protein ZapA [Parashewanella spongiae]RJY06911.1 cell division protein ZapA [Parashewanella spongiae]
MSNRAIDITLLGRTYSIACPAEQEEALIKIAENLEKQLSDLKTRSNSLCREEIVIMAALNIGHELYTEQRRNQDYVSQMDERINLLQSTLEEALVVRSSK